MSETLLPVKKTNSWAVVSLVLGIVALPMICCYGVGMLPAIIAIILGFIARREIKESGGTQTGGGLALTGIILGAAVLVLFVLSCGVIVVLGLLGDNVSEVFENITDALEPQ